MEYEMEIEEKDQIIIELKRRLGEMWIRSLDIFKEQKITQHQTISTNGQTPLPSPTPYTESGCQKDFDPLL